MLNSAGSYSVIGAVDEAWLADWLTDWLIGWLAG
jgi:hypothetical protein